MLAETRPLRRWVGERLGDDGAIGVTPAIITQDKIVVVAIKRVRNAISAMCFDMVELLSVYLAK